MLPSPGAVALKAALRAEENIGVREVGHNGGVFVDTYLASIGLPGSGEPWCMAFVYYRLWDAAGRPADFSLPMGFPRTGSTAVAARWAKRNGLWIPVTSAEGAGERVQRGDLCFFWFPELRRIAHVGIVTGSFDGGVDTVEGNTSPGADVQREGDGVYRRRRMWRALGCRGGFARIPF
ncbi:MAG: CHAP domain-containing protein [Chthonomonadales bacterium]